MKDFLFFSVWTFFFFSIISGEVETVSHSKLITNLKKKNNAEFRLHLHFEFIMNVGMKIQTMHSKCRCFVFFFSHHLVIFKTKVLQ